MYDFLLRVIDPTILQGVITTGPQILRMVAELSFLFMFASVSGDMIGLASLPSNWLVDWRRFYDFRDVPVPPTLNLARRIGTALALPLKTLPAFQGQE